MCLCIGVNFFFLVSFFLFLFLVLFVFTLQRIGVRPIRSKRRLRSESLGVYPVETDMIKNRDNKTHTTCILKAKGENEQLGAQNVGGGGRAGGGAREG